MTSRSEGRRLAAEAFYGALVHHPNSARRVGWESNALHALRLATVIEALSPVSEIDSIVDVGCGEAALLHHLRRAGFSGRYRGEDVRAEAIASAAVEGDATVVVSDGLAGGPSAVAIVCSGTLNTASGVSPDDEAIAALSALWARCEDVLVVDLAVRDRHAPGVGIAAVDLGLVWAHARSLAPVVSVHEDVVPGEASLVLSRRRRRTFARRVSGLTLAEALLAAGEPDAALSAAPEGAHLVRGQALVALGRAREALSVLERATALHGDEARLAMAPAMWRLGDKRGAENLLRELAARGDEARAHLFELLVARSDWGAARQLLGTIEDAWMKRELAARLERSTRGAPPSE